MLIDFSQYQFLDRPSFLIGVDREATDWYSEQTRSHLSLEPNVEYAVRILQPGDKAIDAGANIGRFTLPLAAQGVSVLAVEALPANFSLLCQSVARNGFPHTVPVHAALQDSPGVVHMSGFGAWGQISQGADGVPVPAITLDQLCGIYNFWDASLLKMDIEGAELSAFAGAERFMRQNPDALILFEANEWASLRFNHPVSELLAYVEARGYHLFMFDGKNLLPRTAQSYQEGVFVDYLACRSAAPPLVESFVSRPLSWEERIQLTLRQANNSQDAHRAYTLGMAPTMPREIASDPRVHSAIRQIELDLPAEFRGPVAQISAAARRGGLKT